MYLGRILGGPARQICHHRNKGGQGNLILCVIALNVIRIQTDFIKLENFLDGELLTRPGDGKQKFFGSDSRTAWRLPTG